MVFDTLTNTLAHLPIRARMAFAIKCAEAHAAHVELHSPWFRQTIELMWRSLWLEMLDLWVEQLCERIGPIIDSFPSPTGVPEIDSLPMDLQETLFDIEEAASRCLHCQINDHAIQENLETILAIAFRTANTGAELPSVGSFSNFKLEAPANWGPPLALEDVARLRSS